MSPLRIGLTAPPLSCHEQTIVSVAVGRLREETIVQVEAEVELKC